MTVLLGCPAGRKLFFDAEFAKNATGKQHFCSSVNGVPCFYFYRGKLGYLLSTDPKRNSLRMGVIKLKAFTDQE